MRPHIRVHIYLYKYFFSCLVLCKKFRYFSHIDSGEQAHGYGNYSPGPWRKLKGPKLPEVQM